MKVLLKKSFAHIVVANLKNEATNIQLPKRIRCKMTWHAPIRRNNKFQVIYFNDKKGVMSDINKKNKINNKTEISNS